MGSGIQANGPGLNGWQGEYIEGLYEDFKRDPSSVSPDVQAFFRGFELGLSKDDGGGDGSASRFQHSVANLIAAYRQHGHLAAKIDPFDRPRERPVELSLAHHGLSEADLGRMVDTGSVRLPGVAPLRQVIDKLERTYCGSIGVEYTHILNSEERLWLEETFEKHDGRVVLERADRLHVLRQLLEAESFERFLQKRYPGEKRFSLEGAESLIPTLGRLIERFAELDVQSIVLGMPHRGRLNVLHNVLGKTPEQIFTEFEDNWEVDFADGGGDVKYHRGYSGIRKMRSGKEIHLSLSSNPSHLEAVDPVVLGRTRVKQFLRGDTERRRIVPLLIHGDAAVIGQGMVAETLNLSQLEGYTVGGAIHVVVNNLIGFTTRPEDGRSTRYCTDMSKMIEIPVFHVNAEDPDSVVAAATFAAEYRHKFRKDVFIDLYCYRRHGHNEQDEASFTQPVLAGLIKERPSIVDTYTKHLLHDGVLEQRELDDIAKARHTALEAAQEQARKNPFDPTIDPGSERWRGLSKEYSHSDVDTSIPPELVQRICAALGTTPAGFNVHRKLKSVLQDRANMPVSRQLCHADAEIVAFGSILLDGYPVRLSGQDCRRGTFSQRHAVLRDAESGEPYTPLNHMAPMGDFAGGVKPGQKDDSGRVHQAELSVWDSPLSEQGVMGFEYGCSLVSPEQLVLWEAQFGDFNNGAQVIIDQFISSAQVKWERWSGLVLLLPHGYEGAGPEHSSARMERFLQLCAGNNIEVVYPSTGAQMFHLLRRQVKRPFRRPLVVLTPKSMLRVSTSDISELSTSRFHEAIDDAAFASAQPASNGAKGKPQRAPKGVETILFCTGKIYHELAARRDEVGRDDLAIVRIEQLYPLRTDLIRSIISRYPGANRFCWVQEEPRNTGAFLFIRDQFQQAGLVSELTYIGRDAHASPASGSKRRHKIEQEKIMVTAIGPSNASGKQAKDAPAPPAHARV